MKIEVKINKKTYSGEFKLPTLDDFIIIYNYLATEPFMADIELAKRSFVSGDAEMIDFDNHMDIFLSYRDKLYSVLEPKAIDTFKSGKYEDYNYNLKIQFKDGDKQLTGYFTKPNFITFRKVMSLLDNNLYFEADMELARGCLIKEISDKELIQFVYHPNYISSYRHSLSKLIKTGISTIKKK